MSMQIQLPLKLSLTIALLCASACIVKNDASQPKFITSTGGTQLDKIKILIPHIFKQQWQIGYRYGADCKPADRQNGKALQDAISASMRVWLAPLKELPPARPLVDKFVYKLQADFDPAQPRLPHQILCKH